MSNIIVESNGFSLPYKYQPRPYQLPLHTYMDKQATRQRAFLLAHRRTGKDVAAFNELVRQSQKRVGTYWHMLPLLTQGRKVIWEGKTKDGTAFLDFIPPGLIESKRNDDMLIKLKNGSNIQIVGADRYDTLVGSNPIGVVISEFALVNPAAWDYIRPILNENDGWAIFVTTPRGRNHAYELFKVAANRHDWFCQMLTVEDTTKLLVDSKGNPIKKDNKNIYVPLVTPAMIQEERDSGMAEELIQQEYYCSFDAGQVGSYYTDVLSVLEEDGRFLPIAHNPKEKVYTAWDLGLADSMTIWYFQYYDGFLHIIEYNEFEGVSLIDACHIVTGNIDKIKTMSEDKLVELEAKYGHHKTYRLKDYDHFGPHDIKTRELTTRVSRLDVARKNGIKFRVVPKTGINEGIDAVRAIMSKVKISSLPQVERGYRALKDYKKQYSEEKRIFLNKPCHDWASHGADGFRYLAVGATVFIDKQLIDKSSRFAKVGFDPLSNEALTQRIESIERKESKRRGSSRFAQT